jgi:hypothetical protein
VSTQIAARIPAARRLAGLGLISLAALAAAAGPALAGASAKPAGRQSGKTIVLHYYSVVTSLVYTGPDGTVAPHPPQKPEAGGRLEIFELAYKGTHQSHSKRFAATSHTICVFKTAKGAPTCDGQTAVGGNQMVLFHTPSDGAPAISGGTGRYAGATGGATMKQVGNGNDSDIVVTVHLSN